jgi:hypothetical protein
MNIQPAHPIPSNSQQPGPGYNANLLIDQISFTAHNLRLHCRDPLQ